MRPQSTTTANPRRWQLLWLLAVAQFMLILDVTVVALALPHMQADLGLSRQELTWVVTGYTVMFGGLLLLGGRITDLVGGRTIVMLGLSVFVIASLITGLADGSAIVIIGRLGQGLGAALLSPAALSMLPKLFDGAELGKALGIWSGVGGAGSAIGVLLGGVLTAGPGWPWVFFLNVPVGLILLILLARLLPRLPRGPQFGLDVLGALLVTLATGAAAYGVVMAGETGWFSPELWIPLLIAAVLYALFVLRLNATRSPLIRPGLLRQRPVAAGMFVIWAATALMIAVFFLGSFLLQEHAGYGPLLTGLLFLPVAVGAIIGAQLAGRLVAQMGLRRLAGSAFGLSAAGLAVPYFTIETIALVIALAIGSVGLGGLFVVSSVSAFSTVAPEETGITSGALSTFHELGAAIGVSAASSIAAASLTGSGTEGITTTFGVAALVALAAALISTAALPGRTPRAEPPGFRERTAHEPQQR